jgi:hypothetical protein
MQEAMETPTSGQTPAPGIPGSIRSGNGEQGQGQEIREQVQQQARQAEVKLRDEMDRRTTEFGDQLTSVASAMRRGTEELRGEGKDQAAQLMDRGAEQVDRLGQYLARSNGDRLMRDIEDFGRRRPGMLAAGGLLLGFGAARFLRASSQRREHDSEWDAGSLAYPTEAATDEGTMGAVRPTPTATGSTGGSGSGFTAGSAPVRTAPTEVGGA